MYQKGLLRHVSNTQHHASKLFATIFSLQHCATKEVPNATLFPLEQQWASMEVTNATPSTAALFNRMHHAPEQDQHSFKIMLSKASAPTPCITRPGPGRGRLNPKQQITRQCGHQNACP
eukprot:1158443-Pelagomonas_calceolata.AAC.12